jgi:hypothetical protein
MDPVTAAAAPVMHREPGSVKIHRHRGKLAILAVAVVVAAP